MLSGWIAGWNGRSRIDSNRVIGNSGRCVEHDGIPQKVAVGGGYDKYRDSRWGGGCTVAYEQERNAPRHLTIRGYLAEQRSSAQVTGIGQAELASGSGRKVGSRSPAVRVEDEVCGYCRANVCARIGGRGRGRGNT